MKLKDTSSIRGSLSKLLASVSRLQVVLAFAFILVILLLGITWLIISKSQSKLIEFKSVQTAGVVAGQVTAARSLYSQSVVAKLKRDGFSASLNSDETRGSVPIPAQFLKNLTHQSSNDEYQVRPLSKWNISPEQGLKDEFQRWAWAEIESQHDGRNQGKTDWKPVWRKEIQNGNEVLRYLYPDPAKSMSCVNCHNALENQPEVARIREVTGVEPGKVWKLNDLMGALEVTVPLTRSSEFAATQTRNGLIIFSSVMLVGILLVALFVIFDAIRTKKMTQRLEHQATHDSLTLLLNRYGFELEQDRVIAQSDLSTTSHAVMLLDLDDFKRINDTLGHAVGDAILEQTAKRLVDTVGPEDTVSRLGGDEFAVFLKGCDRERAVQVALNLNSAIDREFPVDEYRLRTRASIGIAIMPDDANNSKETLRCADVAMYVSKDEKSQYAFYRTDQDDNNLKVLSIINDFRKALKHEELSLAYQPKVDLRTGKITGVEALLRWNHTELGYVSPDEIIPVAERCGLIAELTEWTLRTGLNQLKAWLPENPQLSVAINLSVQMLNSPSTLFIILKCLHESGLSSDKLKLEVTENGVMTDPECAEKILVDLNKAGIELSIDDFGTGYSSLTYLHRLPVQELKIDKSFVLELTPESKDALIVSAAIDLAHKLGLKVVAEGVETQAALDCLHAFDCDSFQGYFFSKPLFADQLTKALPELARTAQSLSTQSLRRAV